MKRDFIWAVGGAQGEGIDSTGEIFSFTMHRLGYYVYAYRHFMSLIKGGHTYYKVRVASEQVRHRGDRMDLLLAFDQNSIDYNLPELRDGAGVLYDSTSFAAKVPDGRTDLRLYGVPMTKIATDLGMAIMKNMVAMGASAYLLGLDPNAFEAYIQDRFGKKGGQVVQSNRDAVAAGYKYCQESFRPWGAMPPVPDTNGALRPLMSGNDATALGVIAAGCKIVCAYPITPATEILYTLLRYFPKYGAVVVQAEDEMAACLMAVGSNFAGTRAMTSTSGPGVSLMMETLGLAGMSETPLVVIDVQRGGPSTGLPTKMEQGDLNTALFGSHGEFPRIVLAPATTEDCFYLATEAFNLAERYQTPVIVMSDLALGLSKMTLEPGAIAMDRVRYDRGLRISDEELEALHSDGGYKRYALTESGISARAIPGQRYGRHLAIGNEHDEYGHEMEDPAMRTLQMRKRFRKMREADFSEWGITYQGDPEPDLLLLGWGGTYGVIHEEYERLAEAGHRVAHAHVRVIMPLPEKKLAEYIGRAKRTLVVENNFTAQFTGYLKQRIGFHGKLMSCLKFDGNPFYVPEIDRLAKEVLV